MEDVDKLDNIQDCFIHYQLLRFCQATRLQYLNGQVQLANQQVLQQQHVDHKIANALLKKGTREAYKKCTLQDRAWVDMRLHESHDEASASPTTLSRGTPQHTRPTPGLSPSWALSPALLRRYGCRATTSRIPPFGASLPFARSSTCTKLFCRTTTARSSRLQTSPHSHQMRAAARRQTPGRHLHRRPLAPKTSVRAPLSFHSSTASMRHTS